MKNQSVNLHSLFFRCFLYVFLFIVLPILALSYAAEQNNMNTMLEQQRLSDLKNMETLSMMCTTFTDSVESLGSLLASSPQTALMLSGFDSEPQPVSDYLEEYKRSYSYLTHISLMSPKGVFFAETRLDRSRLSWFFNKSKIQQINSMGANWTKSFSIEFPETKQIHRVISYVVPCTAEDGTLLGYVVLFVDTGRFRDFLASFGESTYILENNCIFASNQNIPFYMKLFQIYSFNYGYLPENRSVILQSGSSPFVTTTLNYPKLDLQFICMTSYDTLKESISVGFPGFYSMAVYGILFALFSAWLIAGRLTKPLTRLKKVMTHVQSGDFSIRYHTRSREKDEISQLGITFNSLLDRIQELIHTLESNFQKQQQIQFQLIQEQVKPHFLYNMLETINSMIRCDRKEETISMVNNLANFYRISLNNGADIIEISQEIQVIESYLALQKVRYVEFMDYSLAFSPNIYHYCIPKLVLQPIVENAIYHGLKEKCEKGMLFVSGYLEKGQIQFEIFDTGCGMSEEKIGEIMELVEKEGDIENHFGISSVIKRLNLYTGNQAKLCISSVPGKYTCFTISYPAAVTK